MIRSKLGGTDDDLPAGPNRKTRVPDEPKFKFGKDEPKFDIEEF